MTVALPILRPSEHPFCEIVIQRHLGPVGEDAQPLAMIHQRVAAPVPSRAWSGRPARLLFGLREQAVERLLQPALRRIERWRLAL